ncbi:cytochrome P450 [Aulographum hederae CBS 113979]|uniref:Cytochrome P450 n=1 Tax=Aulographum hederae CBS 113979 TaxID=1176131 RepID=A0A6G1GX01_9PEZI|nr:cytochrome P450 [Aulographum hederae CBS 113979]
MPSIVASLSSSSLWYGVGILLLGYITTVVVYRRYFHPLARIPGPFLPAVTLLYQSYFNGTYYKEIERMHEKYGPIIRITPNEVHLSDPENYDKIYFMGSKFYKSPVFYGSFCIPFATFCTPSNEVHKHRRAMLNPMFSRKMVLDLEEVVQDKARRLVKITSDALAANKPADLHHAFRAVSVDVITDYAFNKSYNLLGSDDLGADFFAMVRGIGPAFWTFQQFEAMRDLAVKIPPWLAPKLSPVLGHVIGLQMEGVRQIEDVRTRMKEGKLDTKRPTIFSELLDPEKQDGYPVPSTWDLKDEVYSVLAAAADTTGNAMTTAAYHILANKDIYAKARAELFEAFPDPEATLDFQTLEKLPYLTGIVKEGLRLSFGVIGRLPRVTPAGGATFNGHYLPSGTIVGMSSWLMHRNPTIFPSPRTFSPTRWLDPENYRRCDRHMVPFGRGTRQCVGMPLAYAELYITLAMFVHRFEGLKIYRTTPKDLEYEDFFSAYHVAGREWFRAVGKEFEGNGVVEGKEGEEAKI